jgi:hypothetical protein
LHWRFETKNASEGETLGIYIEDEGEGEIRRGIDLYEGGEKNPQESSRIVGGEPWSPIGRPLSPEPVWRRKRGEWNEGVWDPLI